MIGRIARCWIADGFSKSETGCYSENNALEQKDTHCTRRCPAGGPPSIQGHRRSKQPVPPQRTQRQVSAPHGGSSSTTHAEMQSIPVLTSSPGLMPAILVVVDEREQGSEFKIRTLSQRSPVGAHSRVRASGGARKGLSSTSSPSSSPHPPSPLLHHGLRY